MRRPVRKVGLLAMLALAGVLTLGACQPQDQDGGETAGPPTNAEREAEIAASQLAALGGEANAEQRALYTGDFEAVGALNDYAAGEGAWELRLLNDYAQFSRPGLGDDGGVTSPREYHERGVRVTAGPLTITVMAEACTLPTGVQLPYVAHVLFEGVAYQGCAQRGISTGSRPTWASVLPELIPAIDACLARVETRPARVTFASALDEGQVSVLVRESDGGRHECIVDAGGANVSVYEPVSDLDRRNGESDPEFQRNGSSPRACATQAVTREGAPLGWLIPEGC